MDPLQDSAQKKRPLENTKEKQQQPQTKKPKLSVQEFVAQLARLPTGVITQLLLGLNESELYRICSLQLQKIKNICATNPVLAQRFRSWNKCKYAKENLWNFLHQRGSNDSEKPYFDAFDWFVDLQSLQRRQNDRMKLEERQVPHQFQEISGAHSNSHLSNSHFGVWVVLRIYQYQRYYQRYHVLDWLSTMVQMKVIIPESLKIENEKTILTMKIHLWRDDLLPSDFLTQSAVVTIKFDFHTKCPIAFEMHIDRHVLWNLPLDVSNLVSFFDQVGPVDSDGKYYLTTTKHQYVSRKVEFLPALLEKLYSLLDYPDVDVLSEDDQSSEEDEEELDPLFDDQSGDISFEDDQSTKEDEDEESNDES